MDYGEWILICLGVYGEGKYLDEIADNFGVEIDIYKEDMLNDVKLTVENTIYTKTGKCIPQLGNLLASRLFDAVIKRAKDELDAKEEDFDYYCNGPFDTWITYRGEDVPSWDEVEKLCHQNEEDVYYRQVH